MLPISLNVYTLLHSQYFINKMFAIHEQHVTLQHDMHRAMHVTVFQQDRSYMILQMYTNHGVFGLVISCFELEILPFKEMYP